MTPQRRWQLKKIGEGRCAACGKKRRSYLVLCDRCAGKARKRMRRSLGCKPWRPGGPGRPPFSRKGVKA